MTTEKKEDQTKEYTEVLKTPVVRTSYTHITRPDKKYSKYQGTAILSKKDEDKIKAHKKAILAAAKRRWGEATKYTDLSVPFRDGDEENSEGVVKDEYKGSIVFSMSSKDKPGIIVGKNKIKWDELSDEKKKEIQIDNAGYYAVYAYTASTYDKTVEVLVMKDGKEKKVKRKIKGVVFYLKHIWYVKDGERFGSGGGDPQKDFQDTEIDESEFDDEDLDAIDAAIDEDEGFEDGDSSDDIDEDDDLM